MNQKISVLMSAYRNDNAVDFRTAVESVSIKQTCQPNEIVIVVDGPVPDELAETINSLTEEIPYIKTHWLPQNGGLGNAMKIGMELCSNELVARMDADDVSAPNRFEKQVAFMDSHPECDVVGGQMTEFIGAEDNIVGSRVVPLRNEDIHLLLHCRCPFNHVTVVMRRSKVLEVGNYIDWHYNEDYYLWIRMAEAECKFSNLPETLVNVRVGKDMYARRGGWKYFKSEKRLQNYMLKKGIISFSQYLFNVAIRFGVQVAMPNKFRGFVFQKLFRTR